MEHNVAARAKQEPADFEAAISECGFGLFNLYLLLSAMPCLAAVICSAVSISLILPTAECDLQLSVMDKGMLNAVIYAGMILSAVPWGLVADTMGRRVVLIYGCFIDFVVVLCAALSQSKTQLMLFKFMDGLIICGPFAVVVSNLTEFHGKQHRSSVMTFVGISLALAAMALPTLAFLLMPQRINVDIGPLTIHTWNTFIATIALPSFVSGFLHIFVPESPKFLMSQGNYKQALRTFQRIYAWNKHKRGDTYPITELTDPTPDIAPANANTQHISLWQRFKVTYGKLLIGFKQLRPMCSSPYLLLSVKVFILHFCQIMCVNSMRMWMPQIFATMRQFEMQNITDTSICAVLRHTSRTEPISQRMLREECELHQRPDAYVDNLYVGAVNLLGFIVVFGLVRIQVVANHLFKCLLLFATILACSLYFSKSSQAIVIIAALYLTVLSNCVMLLIGMVAIMFPTLMRTMIILLIMTFGRIGSVTGNMMLPIFIRISCQATFIWLSLLLATAFMISLTLHVDHYQSLK